MTWCRIEWCHTLFLSALSHVGSHCLQNTEPDYNPWHVLVSANNESPQRMNKERKRGTFFFSNGWMWPHSAFYKRFILKDNNLGGLVVEGQQWCSLQFYFEAKKQSWDFLRTCCILNFLYKLVLFHNLILHKRIFWKSTDCLFGQQSRLRFSFTALCQFHQGLQTT